MTEVTFKRKWRWTLEGELPNGKFKSIFVKVTTRPNLKIEQNEIDLNGEKVFIPGKAEWDEISVTSYGGDTDWDIINQSIILDAKEKPSAEKLGKFILSLYDGCGCLLEEWHLEEAYFSYIDFEEIDHSCTDDPYVIYTIKFFNCRYINKFENVPMSNKIGTLNENNTNNNVTCPNCKHEFKHFSFPLNNIIY